MQIMHAMSGFSPKQHHDKASRVETLLQRCINFRSKNERLKLVNSVFKGYVIKNGFKYLHQNRHSHH